MARSSYDGVPDWRNGFIMNDFLFRPVFVVNECLDWVESEGIA